MWRLKFDLSVKAYCVRNGRAAKKISHKIRSFFHSANIWFASQSRHQTVLENVSRFFLSFKIFITHFYRHAVDILSYSTIINRHQFVCDNVWNFLIAINLLQLKCNKEKERKRMKEIGKRKAERERGREINCLCDNWIQRSIEKNAIFVIVDYYGLMTSEKVPINHQDNNVWLISSTT